MAVSRENEKLYELMENAPATQQSAAAARAAEALAAAESAAQRAQNVNTADARLDRAINDYLKASGFRYDIANDADYQSFAQQYRQNALSGRESAAATAQQLSGGWSPTYAAPVGSAVSHDIVSRAENYVPTFRALAQQEQDAGVQQAGNAAQMLREMDQAQYQQGRDTFADRLNYLSYLADRYQTERQADVQQAGFAGDIYRARLNSAMSDAQTARSVDNARYQFDSQSAANREQLAADQAIFNQKMAYTAAKDAYNDRVSAQKAAATQQKAAEKAAATQQKAAEKAAAQLEKDKAKYDKAAWQIKNVMNGGKLSGTMGYDLDYNKDGKVDRADYEIASNAAKTGVVTIPAIGSDKAKALINTIERVGSHYGAKSEKRIEEFVKKSNLNQQESMYVYQYFGII